MKMGRALPAAPPSGVLPAESKSRMSRKLWISIPAGVIIGAFVKFRTKKNTPE